MRLCYLAVIVVATLALAGVGWGQGKKEDIAERLRSVIRQGLDLDALARAKILKARGVKPVRGRPVNAQYNVEEFEPVAVRFVRFTVLATLEGGEPCLDELEIYGPDGPANLAQARGARATASSVLPGYAIHQIHHLNDGKYGNDHSWISAEKGKGWAQIELPAEVKVARVVWSRDAGHPLVYRDRLPSVYRVEVSKDGEFWKTVATSEERVMPGEDRWFARNTLLGALEPEQRRKRQELTDEMKRLLAAWAKE